MSSKKGYFMQFFQKFKEIRDYFDQNQSDFASKLDVTQSAYSKYERGERVADVDLINNLIKNFKINPNWLFLDQKPISLDEEPSLNEENINLINDLCIMLTQEQLNAKLSQILVEEIIQKVDIDEYSKPSKFLEILKLDDSKKARPFLFLYYIFREIEPNNNNIVDYMKYLVDTITGYEVMSLKNKPAFSEKIKKEIAAYIELNFKEEECKTLVKNASITLRVLESMMPPSMVLAHRKNI